MCAGIWVCAFMRCIWRKVRSTFFVAFMLLRTFFFIHCSLFHKPDWKYIRERWRSDTRINITLFHQYSCCKLFGQIADAREKRWKWKIYHPRVRACEDYISQVNSIELPVMYGAFGWGALRNSENSVLRRRRAASVFFRIFSPGKFALHK